MRKLLASLVLAAAVAPSAASAGLVLGARLGAGIPGGKIDGASNLNEFVDWAVPLQLDVGGRIGDRLVLAGYLRLAPGRLDATIQDACDATGSSCSVLGLGIGAQADFHFSTARAGPWLGGFAGWEQIRYEAAFGGNKASLSASGWELGAQGGIDFAWGVLTLGPYASLGVGQYGKATSEVNGSKDSQTITDKAVHTWLQLGARAAFVF